VKVEDLKSAALAAKDNPNYQYKDLPLNQMAQLAWASFNKLPESQKSMVRATCTEYGLMTDPDTDPVGLANVVFIRFMCQTNLFFLCKVLDKYRDVSDAKYMWPNPDNGGKWEEHNTHEEICNGFFVRKDPTKKSFKEFALAYIGKKERLLLVPRGGFKSSMNKADCVQWVINYPEVTIMILTGVLDLAKDFVKEIKDHFTLIDTGDKEMVNLFSTKKAARPRWDHDDTPNMFQVLFPEHCIPEDDGKAYEFKSPASTESCTLFAAAIDQNLSGWHVGVMKLDDVVTNENSRTPERIININKQVVVNDAMLHPYGFHDKIGTWYDANDTYGKDMKFIAKCKKEGEPIRKEVYLRAAWWPTAEAAAAGKVESEMTEKDWVLWFNQPGQLTYDFLRYKKMEDADGFAIKYLNDPTQVHRVKFPRELLVRRTIPATQLPQQGLIVTTVDTAFSTKNWADYTVILTSLIYGGRFYIIDMKRDRYNDYELPLMIAQTVHQWRPARVLIEDTGGVKLMTREIYREMDKLRTRASVEYVPLGQGSKKTSKDYKAKPVLRYLGDERLFFSNSCVGLEKIYDELEKFGTAAGQHDDIVSALSILVEQFAVYADVEGKRTQASPAFVSDLKQKQQYDAIYGGDVFSKLYTQTNWAAAREAQDNDPSLSLQEAVKVTQPLPGDVDFSYDPLADALG